MGKWCVFCYPSWSKEIQLQEDGISSISLWLCWQQINVWNKSMFGCRDNPLIRPYFLGVWRHWGGCVDPHGKTKWYISHKPEFFQHIIAGATEVLFGISRCLYIQSLIIPKSKGAFPYQVGFLSHFDSPMFVLSFSKNCKHRRTIGISQVWNRS